MRDCYWTICRNLDHFRSFSSDLLIKAVPTGARFYTKPGSGQRRYSEQGTPDSYTSLRIVLYNRLFFSECPTRNNRISQPEFSTPYRCAQLRIQILFQSKQDISSRTYCYTEKDIRNMARITAFVLNFLTLISVTSFVQSTIPSRASRAEHIAIRIRAFWR